MVKSALFNDLLMKAKIKRRFYFFKKVMLIKKTELKKNNNPLATLNLMVVQYEYDMDRYAFIDNNPVIHL